MGPENGMVKFCQRIVRQFPQVLFGECLSRAQALKGTFPSKTTSFVKAKLYQEMTEGFGQPPTHHYMYDEPHYGKRRNS